MSKLVVRCKKILEALPSEKVEAVIHPADSQSPSQVGSPEQTAQMEVVVAACSLSGVRSTPSPQVLEKEEGFSVSTFQDLVQVIIPVQPEGALEKYPWAQQSMGRQLFWGTEEFCAWMEHCIVEASKGPDENVGREVFTSNKGS